MYFTIISLFLYQQFKTPAIHHFPIKSLNSTDHSNASSQSTSTHKTLPNRFLINCSFHIRNSSLSKISTRQLNKNENLPEVKVKCSNLNWIIPYSLNALSCLPFKKEKRKKRQKDENLHMNFVLLCSVRRFSWLQIEFSMRFLILLLSQRAQRC